MLYLIVPFRKLFQIEDFPEGGSDNFFPHRAGKLQ